VNVSDNLVPLIDNGGQRSYINRRCNYRFRVIPERRIDPDRRKIVDRRKVLNERRLHEPERRVVFKG
jgi:hypothetical protein